MSTPDFASVLNKSAAEVEKPKPLPMGTYICVVLPGHEFKKIGQKETLGAQVFYKPVQPMEDVDTSALADIGNWSDRRIRDTLWLSDDSQWRTKAFFVDVLGMDEKLTFGEMFAQMAGRQFLCKIKHRPSQDGQEMYVEVEAKDKL